MAACPRPRAIDVTSVAALATRGALRPSFLEAGSVAPRIVTRARGSGPAPGGAFVARSACRPAIDDAGALRCCMAARAASVCGPGRADDREAGGEQNCNEKVPQCFLHGWEARGRQRALRSDLRRTNSAMSKSLAVPAFRRLDAPKIPKYHPAGRSARQVNDMPVRANSPSGKRAAGSGFASHRVPNPDIRLDIDGVILFQRNHHRR